MNRSVSSQDTALGTKRGLALGSGWMLVAGLLFAAMGVFVKLGSRYFSAAELVFYRCLFGAVSIAVMVRANRLHVATPHWKMHISRSLAGFCGMTMLFYAIRHLPLATATTLNYTSPLFLVVLSAVVLKERLKPGMVAAVVLGFAGVVILLHPTFNSSQAGAGMIALVSGFCGGVAFLATNQLSRMGEPSWRVVFYFSLVSTLGSAALAASSGFHTFGLGGLAILIGLGASGTLGQLAMTRAYSEGDKLTVGSLAYSTVVFTTLLGLVIWNDMLPPDAWLAMGLIIASGIMAARTNSSSNEL